MRERRSEGRSGDEEGVKKEGGDGTVLFWWSNHYYHLLRVQFGATPNQLCMQAATEENSPKVTDLMESEFFFW